MAPDQVSLRDCPVSVSTTALWGSSVPSAPGPTPLPLEEAAVTAQSLAPGPSENPLTQDREGLLPDHLQQIFTGLCRCRWLATNNIAGYLRPGGDTSRRSGCSASPEHDVQDDLLSCPESVLSSLSHTTHPANLDEVDHPEPDLSDDKGLEPEQLAFTGLFLLWYLNLYSLRHRKRRS